MQVALLQDDLHWMLENLPIAGGGVLKFSGRHRLGTGPLRLLPLGQPTLADGQPVVDVGAGAIDRWFQRDATWALPSRRNLSRLAKLYGLSWAEAFHLQLKLEWEWFLAETQTETIDGVSQTEPCRLIRDTDEPLAALIRQPALALKTWPARTFQHTDGSAGAVERYPDLVDEFCEAWLADKLDDIQNDIETVLPIGVAPHAFAPPTARRQAGHCYFILLDFTIHQDIQRGSIFSAMARQFHAALTGFVEQWQAGDATDQANCLVRLEKWHAASREFDTAAVQLESARQVAKQIETRWFIAFGAVYTDFLEAHQRKEKLRAFLRWLKDNPRLSEQELEQRYAAEKGDKDKSDIELLATARIVADLHQRLKGEGASDEEVLEYFGDMKRMYRSIAWLTHPDRHTEFVPDEVRQALNALWLDAAAIRRGDRMAGTTLRRAELRRLIARAREICQQANLPFEERLLPFEATLPATNTALQREIAGLESDVRRVRNELAKLARDEDFLSKKRDLEPPEAIADRVADYAAELDQLKRDIAALEADIAAIQAEHAAPKRA